LACAIFCVLGPTALAQNDISIGSQGTGPMPLNTKQHAILNTALSPQTRQTLQAAMNSVGTTDTAHAASQSK